MPLPIAAAGLGLQFAGQLFSNIQAAKRRKKEDQMIRERKGDINREFAEDMLNPYYNSAEAVNAQTRMKEQMQDVMKGMQSNAISSGATQENKIAQQSELNKGYGQFMGNLAGMGTRRRDILKNQHRGRLDSIFGLELGQQKENTQSAVNLGQNMSNIGSAALAANTMMEGKPNDKMNYEAGATDLPYWRYVA